MAAGAPGTWRRLQNCVGRRSTRNWASILSVGHWMPPSHTSTAPWKSNVYNKARLKSSGDLFQAWMIRQIVDGKGGLEQLVCEGKHAQRLSVGDRGQERPLRPPADCVNIAQVTVYARALGTALTQKPCEAHESSERVRSSRRLLPSSRS